MEKPGGEPNWPDYFRRLQAYLQWQTERITELQRTVASLQSELAALKEQKGVRIDRIEYSFDQLKVERLDGTLNIGITPGGLQSIEEFAVNGQTAKIGAEQGPLGGTGPFPGAANTQAMPGAQSMPGGNEMRQAGGNGSIVNDDSVDWVQQIGRHIQTYLDDEAAEHLRRWVDEHNLPLGPEEQRLVLDDIRAQLDDRVRYYAKQSGNQAAVGQSFESVARDIIERTKRDIRTAIDTYMTGLRPEEET